MATKVSIAIKREQALKNLVESTTAIAALLGIGMVTIPQNGRDAELLQAEQLEVVAEFQTAMLKSLQEQSETEEKHEGLWDRLQQTTQEIALVLGVTRLGNKTNLNQLADFNDVILAALEVRFVDKAAGDDSKELLEEVNTDHLTDAPDYEDMTVAQLHNLVDGSQINIPPNARKADIIQALSDHNTNRSGR